MECLGVSGPSITCDFANIIQRRYSVTKDVKVIVDFVIPCSHSEKFGYLLLIQLKIPDMF